jgi:hypothetical protein
MVEEREAGDGYERMVELVRADGRVQRVEIHACRRDAGWYVAGLCWLDDKGSQRTLMGRVEVSRGDRRRRLF